MISRQLPLSERPLWERRKSRSTWRAGALLGSLAFMVTNIAAATEPLTLRLGMGGVADPGAMSCEYFNTLYPNAPTGFRQTLLYWAEGYVYGKSGRTIDQALAAAPPAAKPWNFDTLTDHLVDYCREHPEAGIPATVDDLWRRLQPSAQP
jgi:hypothetical protein